MTPVEFSRMYPLRSARVKWRRIGTVSGGYPLLMGPLFADLMGRWVPQGGTLVSTAPGTGDLEAYMAIACPELQVRMVFPADQVWFRALLGAFADEALALLEESYLDFVKRWNNPVFFTRPREVRDWVIEKENLFGHFLLSLHTADGNPRGRIVRSRHPKIDEADWITALAQLRDQIGLMRSKLEDWRFKVSPFLWGVDPAELEKYVPAVVNAWAFLGVALPVVWFHDITVVPMAPGRLAGIWKALEGAARFVSIMPQSYLMMFLGAAEQIGAETHVLQGDKVESDRMSDVAVVSNREF